MRNLSSQLLAQRLSELRKTYGSCAAVVGGDWNMSAGCTAYRAVTGKGFKDVRLEAESTTTSGSYNAWDRTSGYTVLDYLFMASGMSAAKYQVVEDVDAASGLHVSDHSPIMAEIVY